MKKKEVKTKMPSKGKAPKKSAVVNETNRIIDQGDGILGDQATEREFEENSSESAFSISETAKILGIEEDRFIDFLVEQGYMYSEGEGMPLQACPEWVEMGYFVNVPEEPEEPTVPEENGVPFIEEKEATDRLIAIRDQLLQILPEINTMGDQIAAFNEEFREVETAYVAVLKDVVRRIPAVPPRTRRRAS